MGGSRGREGGEKGGREGNVKTRLNEILHLNLSL